MVPNDPFATGGRAENASAVLLFDVNPLADERMSTVEDERERPSADACLRPGIESSELSKRP